LLIHVLGIFSIGIVMLICVAIALVKNRKRKGGYKGTWMGILGLVLGMILTSTGGLIIVDYLIWGAA